MEPRISVVINTLNEEENLPFALRSVSPWADEIVVVDMHSDDRTVEIARDFGAKVYLHERSPIVDAARGYALAQATGDWVFLLDADEVIPAPLADRLKEIARSDDADVVTIPRLNYLLGVPIRHTGWGPEQDRPLRFFRRGAMRASDVIHDYLHPTAGARILELPYHPDQVIFHFAYLDSAHFIAKLNRYTGVEALQAFGRGERATTPRAVLCATKEFLSRYVKNGGYRDGWRGFYLAAFMAFYRLASFAKLKELESSEPADDVRRRYGREAESVLRTHTGEPTIHEPEDAESRCA